jgi:hypothetical protein
MADNFDEKYNTKEFERIMREYDEGKSNPEDLKSYFGQVLKTYTGNKDAEVKDFFK